MPIRRPHFAKYVVCFRLPSTWRPCSEQPLYVALGKVADRHLGTSNDKRWCLDGDALRALFVDAGFVEVKVSTITLTEQRRQFPVRMSAMASNFDLSALSEVERECRLAAVEADSAQVLTRFVSNGGLAAPSTTNIVSSIAPVRKP